MRLLRELRRRRVFRVAGIYIVAAWVAVQVFSEAFPALNIPAEAIRFVWIAAILGFPVALVFGWFFDITPQGIRRTPPAGAGEDVDLGLGRTDAFILIAIAAVAVGIVYQLSIDLQESEPAFPVVPDIDPMSLAVLPLDNLSGDPEQAFFVNGMHDALISDLSRISGLKVTSRTSTRAYEAAIAPMPEIGQSLGVANIIEGSVWRVDDRVRITVQLIKAETDEHIWTDSWERDISDVMVLQSEITQAIAERVEVTLTDDESSALLRHGPVDPDAYVAYLKGMFHVEMFTREDLELAVRHFERAIEIDPDYALAHWGLNRACRFQLQAGLVRPSEVGPRCNAPLVRALELDGQSAEVHLGLALSYWVYDYNWELTFEAFDRAIALNPNYAEAHIFYGHFLALMGRVEESIAATEKARELDPLNPFFHGLHGTQLTLIGKLEEGIDEVNASIEAAPSMGFGFDVLWWAYAELGQPEKSYEAALKHFEITVGIPEAVEALEAGYAAGGIEEAMLTAAETLAELATTRYVPEAEIATLYDYGGDSDNAIRWLEMGIEARNPTMPYMGASLLIRNSRSDPRFHEILRQMNLAMWIKD